MKVESEIKVYEKDGNDLLTSPKDSILKIKSHWNLNSMVVIDISELKDCNTITVTSKELLQAIQNATNH